MGIPPSPLSVRVPEMRLPKGHGGHKRPLRAREGVCDFVEVLSQMESRATFSRAAPPAFFQVSWRCEAAPKAMAMASATA